MFLILGLDLKFHSQLQLLYNTYGVELGHFHANQYWTAYSELGVEVIKFN